MVTLERVRGHAELTERMTKLHDKLTQEVELLKKGHEIRELEIQLLQAELTRLKGK
jgi:hypothetical protein